MKENICNEPNCVKEIEKILWNEDTILKCKDHGQTSEKLPYFNVNELGYDHYSLFITKTREIILADFQKFNDSLTNELEIKIQSLKNKIDAYQKELFESAAELEKTKDHLKNINELIHHSLWAILYIDPNDLNDCKNALYQVNYLKQNLKSHSITNLLTLSEYFFELKQLKEYFFSQKTFYQNKDISQSIYHMAGNSEKIENQASSYSIISVENYKSSKIERWKVTNDKGKIQTMKFIRNANEDTKTIIKYEIDFINKNQLFFTSTLPFEEQGLIGYYSIYIEPLENQLNNKFTIQDINNFFYFFRDFMNTSVMSIEVASIDPSIIGYQNNKFYILDFKYMSSPYDKNYSAPEVLNGKSVKASSSFIYTSGLIAIEMLGQKVAGFNTFSAFELITSKINSLEINDELKQLLQRMVNPDRSLRITRNDFNKSLNSPTLFS